MCFPFIIIFRVVQSETKTFIQNKTFNFIITFFVQIEIKIEEWTLRCPACVSSCAVLVCMGSNWHLIRQKSEILLIQELTDL